MLLAHILQPGTFPIDRLIAAIALTAALTLYFRAIATLRERGRAVSRAQQSCYYTGIVLIAIGLLSPIDGYSGQLLSAHMAQHLLISDLAGPMLLMGVRAPVLFFYWPKPLLVTFARMPRVRRVWGAMRRPRVALPVWLLGLYVWHIPALYELALHNLAVHFAEHVTFVFTGMLMWWPLLDPTRKTVEGGVWKSFYITGARMAGGMVGVALIVIQHPIYPTYAVNATALGVRAVTDQQIAGTLMMFVDFVVATAGFFGFLLRSGDPATARHGMPEVPDSGRRVAATVGDSR